MKPDSTRSLPLAQPATAGCSCCGPQEAATSVPAASVQEGDISKTTASYPVIGMTCSHCVSAVTEELAALPGVTGVSVNLVPRGTSTVNVTSDTPLDIDQVHAALQEAGDYHLASA